MIDTNSEMTEKYEEMLRKKTGLDRLKMGCSMFGFSKSLVMNSILRQSPALSTPRLKREIFLRFYGDDFDKSERVKIENYLLNETRSEA